MYCLHNSEKKVWNKNQSQNITGSEKSQVIESSGVPLVVEKGNKLVLSLKLLGHLRGNDQESNLLWVLLMEGLKFVQNKQVKIVYN